MTSAAHDTVQGTNAPRELVLASAGSGKTFRISSRIIGLIAYGEEPEAVLAATFTRKAAGQILDRVLSRLAAAVLGAEDAKRLAAQARIEGAEPLPEDRAFWAAVLERVVDSLHRLNIGTLDAFFMRAASSFETELGLPPGWRIPSEPTVARLRSRALLAMMEEADRHRLMELLRLIGRGEARRSVHDHLFRMMDQLVAVEYQLDPEVSRPWSAFRSGSGGPPSAAEREALARTLEGIVLPTTKAGTAKARWREAAAAGAEALRAGDWAGLVGLGLCQKVAAGEDSYDSSPIGPEVRAIVERSLDAARSVLRSELATQVEALGELTRDFTTAFRRLQAREGYFGFSDVTRMIAAGEPLGDRSDLYYRLDVRTRHLLLDEFQDTSLAQWEALRPIVDEVLTDPGRAGVIVADPKQSIYGWRGAEPSIVAAIGARYGLPEEPLTTSYRSSQVVLDLVNRVFDGIEENGALRDDPDCASTAARWAENFGVHRAEHRHLPGYVRVEVGPADEGRGGQRPLLCRRAAERVAELRATCPSHTIGVLTRTNAAVARIFLELRQLGLQVSQEGGNPLTDSGAGEAVLALLRVADHPGDAIARYHVATSPLGRLVGFTDHRDTAGAARLSHRIRHRLLHDGYGRTITDLVKEAVPFCDSREARRLAQLAELAHRHDGAATLRPTDFVRLAAAERVEDRTAAEIRVMTVHQAKGLEFDIVVLPQLDAQIFRGGRPAPVAPYRADPAGRITAVFPAAGKEVRCLFPELEAPERQRRAAVLRDGLSAFYVALTRARYAVHAIVAPDGKSGPSKAMSAARILREALLAPDGASTTASPGDLLHEAGNPEWYLDPAAAPEGGVLAAPAAEPVPSLALRAPPADRIVRRERPSGFHDDARIEAPDLLRIDTAEALGRGSIVHAWFERISWSEDPVPDDLDLLDVARRLGTGVPEERLYEMLADFRGWLAHAGLRQALSRANYMGEATVECELPFIVRRGDAILEGVIDRLVLVREGGRVVRAEILDYKTDRITGDGASVAATTDRYRSQLAAYAGAVAQLYDIPVDACRAFLVLLDARRVEEVSLAATVRQPATGS